MVRKCMLAILTAILLAPTTKAARDRIHITHAYANTNPQSLIGLPMGSHKTIVDTRGNLHWSQWSLKRRGLDVPFGFSAQMAGIPADWVAPGEHIRVQNAPVTFGGEVSFRLAYLRPGRMTLTLTPPARPVDLRARFPIGEGQSIKSATVNGKQARTFSRSQVFLPQVAMPVTIEVEFR